MTPPPLGGDPPPGRPPRADAPVLVARGLRRSFGAVSALDGLDLEVGRGEIFGLVGPDGAGKTTAMRVLCGVLSPDGGSAEVAGFDLLRQPGKVKRRIGYMSQRFSLYEDLTVSENLFFFASLHRVPRKERVQREERLLGAFRLSPFRHRLARALSGGMKQKLALACTLLHRPELLLLDEPTTGVDPVSRREFWKILYGLAEERIAILVSTPYMDEAERCHRLALVSGGRVLLRGTPGEIRSSMTAQVLELEAFPQRLARDLVGGRPEVLGCAVFGGRLHVLVEDAAGAARPLRDFLASSGVEVRSVRTAPPGLEDVFVSRLAGEGGGR